MYQIAVDIKILGVSTANCSLSRVFAANAVIKFEACTSMYNLLIFHRYAMKCLDKKRIKMKGGETLALNERIMLSLVSTGVRKPLSIFGLLHKSLSQIWVLTVDI